MTITAGSLLAGTGLWRLLSRRHFGTAVPANLGWAVAASLLHTATMLLTAGAIALLVLQAVRGFSRPRRRTVASCLRSVPRTRRA